MWSEAKLGCGRVVIKCIYRYSRIGPVLGSGSFHCEKAYRGPHIVSKRKANNIFGLTGEKSASEKPLQCRLFGLKM